MKKKSQCVMEFLMTYGWAILVVLIAVGALAYFGFLDPERFLPDRCKCSYVDMQSLSGIEYEGVKYFDCMNTTKNINWEEKKIEFSMTTTLFYCNENKTLVPVI